MRTWRPAVMAWTRTFPITVASTTSAIMTLKTLVSSKSAPGATTPCFSRSTSINSSAVPVASQDFSYAQDDFRPRGLQLFHARVRPVPLPVRVVERFFS